ncbi:MAG: hypothetical protein AB9Q22_10230 [Candidatus Reddybacter sp.]
MSLSSTIDVNVSAVLDVAADIGTAKHSIAESIGIALKDGAGLNQANQMFTDQRTVALSTTDTLDLSGTLVNNLGQTVALTKVKALIISAAVGNGSTLTVGGNVNAFADWLGAAAHTVKVRPGGVLCLVAPDATAYAVTGGTGDLLDITNDDGAAAATYDIVVIGVE